MLAYDPKANIPAELGGNLHLQQRNGYWFCKEKLVIPPNSPIKTMILQEFHDSPKGGHAGINRTLARIAGQF